MQVTINGAQATSGRVGGVTLSIREIDQYDANVTVHVGDVLLMSQQRWGANSAPGWLMNVQFATSEQPANSSSPSICATQANRDGLYPFPQLTQPESLFGSADYAVRPSMRTEPCIYGHVF